MFRAPYGSGGGGVGGWGWGWLGGVPTHVHTHVHACTHMHVHAHMVNMIISCKWPPPLGEYLGIPYDVMRVQACACMCMCTWVGCTLSPPPILSPPPTPYTHPPTPRGTHGISQNSIALELIEIFQFCLKI